MTHFNCLDPLYVSLFKNIEHSMLGAAYFTSQSTEISRHCLGSYQLLFLILKSTRIRME